MTATRHLAFSLALACVLLGGCASLQVDEAARAERVCLNTREITSFGPLDDRHAYVKVGTAENYLLTVDASCMGFQFARGFMIADGARRICGDGFGFVEFAEPGQGTRRCRVEALEPVPDKATARELIEAEEEK